VLKRRTLLLSMLSELSKPVTTNRLHLLVALLSVNEANPSWYFIPTDRGPFSVDLLHDLRAFEKAKFVQIDEGGVSVDQAVGEKELSSLDTENLELLYKTIDSYAAMQDDLLLDHALLSRPFWGIRTKRKGAEIQQIRQQVSSAIRGLYTLGYEGLSIDSFINLLLMVDVQQVIDVREFAFSRRSEYAKKNLDEALSLAGITYTGVPEVGIPTKARKEILEDKSKEELLAYYESEILPDTGPYADEVARLVRKHNIALICHEEDPGQCHRSLFAASVIKAHPDIGAIHDLRTEVRTGWIW
jgi:hypothetical protein